MAGREPAELPPSPELCLRAMGHAEMALLLIDSAFARSRSRSSQLADRIVGHSIHCGCTDCFRWRFPGQW